MVSIIRFNTQQVIPVIIGICLLVFAILAPSASAITALPTPAPKPGSFGLEATKKKAPPSQAATITTPGSGASFATSPITVNGICVSGLMVQVYNNGVMVGAVMCVNGSFSMQVSLFAGINELSAIVYDELDQAGPVSNIVTVTYNNTSFTAFGTLLTLTSSYGRRAAPAGTQLTWPLQLTGGTGPYAFSIDWGDGSKPELKSHALAGVITIDHVFKKAGVYTINITVTDVNGVSAFLQLVAVASGKVDGNGAAATDADKQNTPKPEIMWVPTLLSLALLAPAFWLGRRSQLLSLRNKMLKERDAYQGK